MCETFIETQEFVPSGVLLKPLEIEAMFEEISLEQKQEEFAQSFLLEETDSSSKDIADQNTDENQQLEMEESFGGKRSYRQFCLGKNGKEFKIFSSLCLVRKRPTKRVNV